MTEAVAIERPEKASASSSPSPLTSPPLQLPPPTFGSDEFHALLLECIKAPGLYRDDDEEGKCRQLVERLRTIDRNDNHNNEDDDDLVTQAAHTSYAYWYLSTTVGSDGDKETMTVDEKDKTNAAMKEARRHFVGAGRDFEKALSNLTESCKYRKVCNFEWVKGKGVIVSSMRVVR